MRTRYMFPVALALAAPLSVGWAQAPKPVDPDSLPKVECSDFKFSPAFLDKYPKAPAACQEGRVYKGAKYAKFTGKVYLNSKDTTTVEILNVAGDTVTTLSFKPKPGASVNIDGKPVKFSKLHKGEKISFWVAETRMEAQSMPSATRDHWIVTPPAN